MTAKFVRARSDDQKRERRATLLDGARRAVQDKGVNKVSLSDFAKEAGIAKSAFYKYFSSKEEILAHILMQEFQVITENLRSKTAGVRDIRALAKEISYAFADRPLAPEILSEISRTLDQATPLDRLIEIKRLFVETQRNWTEVILQSPLGFDVAGAKELVKSCYAYTAGLWPLTRERPDLLKAATEAGFRDTYGDFRSEMERFIVLQCGGILSESR